MKNVTLSLSGGAREAAAGAGVEAQAVDGTHAVGFHATCPAHSKSITFSVAPSRVLDPKCIY